VQSLSALTFLTLLWLGSTALEQAEKTSLSRRTKGSDNAANTSSSSSSSESNALLEADRRCNTDGQQAEETVDGLWLLCREDVQLVLGLCLTTAWIGERLPPTAASTTTKGRMACRWVKLNRLTV
jgi:hypothetical protein